jgi:cytochrome c
MRQNAARALPTGGYLPVRMRNWISIGLVAAGVLRSVHAASIPDVLQKVDPATGKALDTTTEFSVSGIVSARATLTGDVVLAFVQPPGGVGLPIVASKADAALLAPRNEVTLAGKLGDGPFGWAALKLKSGSVTLQATNKAFGASEPRGAAFFKDASALGGRYVQLTNVSLAAGKFSGGTLQASGDGGEVTVRVSTATTGRDVPTAKVNVFGVPVKVDGKWELLASRILPVDGRTAQTLAAKHTCLTCHNPDTKMVGPSYRDIAARYKDDAEALPKVLSQIERGGTGRWGTVPMPPLGAKVPEAERKVLGEWILFYRWDAVLAD